MTLNDMSKSFYPSNLFKKYMLLRCSLTQEKHHFLITLVLVLTSVIELTKILKEEINRLKIIRQ